MRAISLYFFSLSYQKVCPTTPTTQRTKHNSVFPRVAPKRCVLFFWHDSGPRYTDDPGPCTISNPCLSSFLFPQMSFASPPYNPFDLPSFLLARDRPPILFRLPFPLGNTSPLFFLKKCGMFFISTESVRPGNVFLMFFSAKFFFRLPRARWPHTFSGCLIFFPPRWIPVGFPVPPPPVSFSQSPFYPLEVNDLRQFISRQFCPCVSSWLVPWPGRPTLQPLLYLFFFLCTLLKRQLARTLACLYPRLLFGGRN